MDELKLVAIKKGGKWLSYNFDGGQSMIGTHEFQCGFEEIVEKFRGDFAKISERLWRDFAVIFRDFEETSKRFQWMRIGEFFWKEKGIRTMKETAKDDESL